MWPYASGCPEADRVVWAYSACGWERAADGWALTVGGSVQAANG